MTDDEQAMTDDEQAMTDDRRAMTDDKQAMLNEDQTLAYDRTYRGLKLAINEVEPSDFVEK